MRTTRAPRTPRDPRPARPAPKAPHPLLAAYFAAIDPPGRGAPPPPTPGLRVAEPLGPEGAALDSLGRALAGGADEALLVFNPEGLARVVQHRAEAAARLPSLLGSPARAAALLDRMQACSGPAERTAALLDTAQRLLAEQSKLPYTTLFWIDDTWGRTASHALLHSTGEPLRFRLIKDLMWGLGDARPGFEARALDPLGPPPPPDSREAQAKRLIQRACADGAVQVSHFTRALPEQPEVLVAPKHFKQLLLQLEATGHIRVLDKDGSGRPLPAAKRPKREGVPTLGDDFWIVAA